MSLKEILQKIITTNESILLSDSSSKEWEAGTLLESLSGPKLETKAYMQPGLYIAEVNEGGYLGRVLYKIKQK